VNNTKKRVLILCTGNSARSQMGEGLLRHLDGDRLKFLAPAPSALSSGAGNQVMGEIGIDISQHRSKSLDEFLTHLSITSSRFAITRTNAARLSGPSHAHWVLTTR
jgi:protein-tyrosine-phosphatase